VVAPWLFLAPSLLFVFAMVLVPFGDAVRRSFFSAMSRQFVGLQNYIAVFRNEAFQLAAKNTAKFALVCIPLLLLFSLVLAMLLNAAHDARGIYKTSFLVPIAIPVASMVLLWRVIFHQNGLLNLLLSKVGLPPQDWLNSGFAFGVLVFTYLWKNMGYDMVLWLSGISGIPPALYESAQMDGAGWWKRLRKITLPGLVPTLFTVTVLSLLNSFKVFREAYLIAGGYPNDSIYMLQHLFSNWFVSLDVDKMCAGAALMALVVFLLILLLQKIWAQDAQRPRKHNRRRRRG
jgi:multiple sugar transport system permease protein